MATPIPLSAKDAKVRANNFVLYVAEWEVDPSAGEFDTSNFEGMGFEDAEATLRRATGTVRGFWDAGNNPHSNPPNIKDGATLLNLQLFVADLGSPHWFFPKYLVLRVPVRAIVTSGIMFEFHFRNKGLFKYPGEP